MQLIGLARLGKDCELRTTQNGEMVTNLSLAYNYGRKDQDGKRPTQWVEASLWGKRAEVLLQYLTKGRMVCVTVDEIHMETYQGRNGEGIKLTGNVSQIELAGGEQTGQQQRQAAAPAARPAPAPKFTPETEDDIPF